MELAPLHPHELLSWMAIQRYPGAYALGMLARHVTIYSQQMRAFNLVDALCRTGQLADGVQVVVVGGGVAGLTAAAAAAARGADVTVVEREAELFPIQRNAGSRYLHPHVYDWPLVELNGEDWSRAGFPFLDWRAGDARKVFADLEEGWKKFKAKHGGATRLLELLDTELTGLARHERAGWQKVLCMHRKTEEMALDAQVVILALGFGRESERPYIQKYWDESPLDSISARKLRWLVSGYGDGGLTDLMRLCIKSFRHDQVVSSFARNTVLVDTLREQLPVLARKAARASRGSADYVRDAFEVLYARMESGSRLSADIIRSDTIVTLNAPGHYLEADGSSILNRFIVFQLEKLEAFSRQDGWLKLPIPAPTEGTDGLDRFDITFTNPDGTVICSDVFNRVVIRHGPEAPWSEQRLPELYDATGELRKRWKGQPQSSDRTRIRIWDPADFDLKSAPKLATPADATDEEVDLQCLVLESTVARETGPLKDLVESALMSRRLEIKRLLGRTRLEPDPKLRFETIRINEALSSKRQYDRTIQQVCQADVAIVDVTDYEPGIMLLLGIRSVVRRGVTLVTTNRTLDNTEWSRLPFNLKELYPLSVDSRSADPNSPEYPTNRLGNAVVTAFSQHLSLPTYQDLPAYEAVRRFAPPTVQDAQSILWLCSFDAKYERNAQRVSNGVLAQYFETLPNGARRYRLERITEIVSPQLVSQRLYSAIRRVGLCIVDWTFWRPNVFFELGVRLAVNSMGPVCILEREPEESQDGQDPAATALAGDGPSPALLRQRDALKKLFRPVEYDLKGGAQSPFEEVKNRHLEMEGHEAPTGPASPIPPTYGSLPYDHTYRLVGASLPLEEEPGASTTYAFLQAAAEALIGVSSTMDPTLPVLYANVNHDLDRQARRAAVELLVAAWQYMTLRYPIGMRQQRPELQEAYESLSYRLLDLLGRSDDPQDGALIELIQAALDPESSPGDLP